MVKFNLPACGVKQQGVSVCVCNNDMFEIEDSWLGINENYFHYHHHQRAAGLTFCPSVEQEFLVTHRVLEAHIFQISLIMA